MTLKSNYIPVGTLVEVTCRESSFYGCMLYVSAKKLKKTKDEFAFDYYLGSIAAYKQQVSPNETPPPPKHQGPFQESQLKPVWSQSKIIDSVLEKSKNTPLEWINIRFWPETSSGSIEIVGKNKKSGIEFFSMQDSILEEVLKKIKKIELKKGGGKDGKFALQK